MFQNLEGKALPSRPAERDSKDTERLSIVTDTDEDETNLETATATPIGLEDTCRAKPLHLGTSADIPPRQRSLQSSSYRVEGRDIQFSNRVQAHNPPTMQYDGLESAAEVPLHLEPPVIHEYMPPPLSPRRPLSPAPPRELAQSPTGAPVLSAPSDESSQSDSAGQDNDQHTSWLNTINESSGSSASSVHSRRSSIGLRRKHIRNPSGQTEAEFDAALDAAVEAAYDDGFEPDDEEDYDEQPTHDPEYHFGEPEPLSFARRNVELAEENVREAEREAAITLAKEREKQRLLGARDSIDMGHDDDEADEEERMLEEMTRDYVMDDEYDLQTKSALPRQSGSSGFSGRTWGSSIGSNLTSAGTSLSTVAEASVLLSMDTQLKENPLPPPLHPPPSSALPPPPKSASPNLPQQNDGIAMRPPILTARNSSPGVRERRLSGMKRMPLKIETNAQISDSPNSEAPKTQPESILARLVTPQAVPEPPNSALAVPESQQVLPSLAFSPFQSSATVPSRRKGSSPFFGSDSTDVASSTASALTRVTSADSDTSVPSMPGSPARFASKAATGLRKNFSSSSLRIKSLTVSVPDALDGSSNASLSSMSSTPKQPKVPSPAVPTLPTPMDPSFIIKGQPMCGIYLFDSDIHSPISPGSPNPLANNPPLQLEPCPESTMLRPFWFLRSIYQTIAHPRGGYISNRLFVPRDIWRVKNIKLKCVEEKVSSCDLLTAALLKLGKVDTLDANAILEELEFFQNVMEQVQSNLSKKLGNEVGVQGAAQLFKSLGTGDETSSNPEALSSKTTNANSKSYLSWRKLRSKNAVGPGSNLISPNIISKDWSREHPMIESLPMTTAPNPRFAKRDVNQVQCIGPNPSYMGALARLCDAAQILGERE